MRFVSLRRLTLAVLTLSAAGVGAAVASCSSGDPSALTDGSEGGVEDPPADVEAGRDSAAPSTPLAACRAYVTASCERAAECGLTLPACSTLQTLCPDYLFGAGSTGTPDSVLACAEVRRKQPCSELRAPLGAMMPSCLGVGTRPAGEPCNFASQCASGACVGGGGVACGRCGALSDDAGCGGDVVCGPASGCSEGACKPITPLASLEVGASCPSQDAGLDCPFDQPCSSAAPSVESPSTCQPAPANGADCRFRPGALTPVCKQGTCIDAGDRRTCTGPRARDESCGDGLPCGAGLYCDGQPQGTCRPRGSADKPCGSDDVCLESLYCLFTSGGGGTCKARPRAGDPCPTAPFRETSVPCLAPATCADTPGAVDGTLERRCVLPAAALGEACDPPVSPCGAGVTCNAAKRCELPPCVVDAGADGDAG